MFEPVNFCEMQAGMRSNSKINPPVSCLFDSSERRKQEKKKQKIKINILEEKK